MQASVQEVSEAMRRWRAGLHCVGPALLFERETHCLVEVLQGLKVETRRRHRIIRQLRVRRAGQLKGYLRVRQLAQSNEALPSLAHSRGGAMTVAESWPANSRAKQFELPGFANKSGGQAAEVCWKSGSAG